MKKHVILVCTVLLMSFAYGQQHYWKEMESFHEQVGTILHPVETGNLRPVKEKSGELLSGSEHWQASVIPADCNYPAIKTDLDDLVKICRELNEAVRLKRGNAEIKKRAIQLHNKFHQILAAAGGR